MSVLMEFAIFPTDKGESVSEYVSKVIAMIRESGYPYKLTPMGTIVETEHFAQSLQILQKAQDILIPVSNRIYCNAKFDIKKNKTGMLEAKIQSIENKIGKVNQ